MVPRSQPDHRYRSAPRDHAYGHWWRADLGHAGWRMIAKYLLKQNCVVLGLETRARWPYTHRRLSGLAQLLEQLICNYAGVARPRFQVSELKWLIKF